MRKLKIAIVAPLDEQVPPPKYGGTERVVYSLVENLVAMGHDVTLFATGDSRTSAKLVPVFPEAIRTLPEAKDFSVRQALYLVGIGRMLDYLSKHNFDLVHNHFGWLFLPFASSLNMPTVTTFHCFSNKPAETEVYRAYRNANYISISNSQRKILPQEITVCETVYNGIDVPTFTYFPKPKDYYAFLASIFPGKGPLEAIQIAKKAGVKLVMAGKIDPVNAEYFEKEIKPHIDGNQITFIGEIGHEEKVKLLGNAKALLAPIQWEEPFGLYFVEAMICGTPVIANNRGSVPEVIIDKKTGYIVNDVDEAAKCIAQIDKINRMDCHEHVKNNFSAEIMTKNYLSAYEKIIANHQKHILDPDTLNSCDALRIPVNP